MLEEKRKLFDHGSASDEDRRIDPQTAQIDALLHEGNAEIIHEWFDEF